jgi:hypothetical protein
MKDWRTIPLGWNLARTEVQPFAGVYPTRWKIEMDYALERGAERFNRRFVYLGKPNPTIAARVRYLAQHATLGFIKAKEFDRGGMLAYVETYPPRMGGSLAATDWNHPFRFYYPWLTGSGEMITSWASLNRTMHRIPLLYQGTRAMVYHSGLAADISPASWSEHKTWLRSVNLRLAKPR